MKGQLLLYNIDRNNEIIQERYDSSTNELPLQISKPAVQQQTLILKKEGADGIQSQQSEMLNEANQITDLIKQILNTPEQKQETTRYA